MALRIAPSFYVVDNLQSKLSTGLPVFSVNTF